MNKNIVKNVILQAIEKISNIRVTDENKSLFNFEWNISPMDIVYIINEIEISLSMDVAKIIANSDYRILSVSNLTEAICAAEK